MKLGSLMDNYDVKPLSKSGDNRKNRTNYASHPLSISWGTPICKAGKQRVPAILKLTTSRGHPLSLFLVASKKKVIIVDIIVPFR